MAYTRIYVKAKDKEGVSQVLTLENVSFKRNDTKLIKTLIWFNLGLNRDSRDKAFIFYVAYERGPTGGLCSLDT